MSSWESGITHLKHIACFVPYPLSKIYVWFLRLQPKIKISTKMNLFTLHNEEVELFEWPPYIHIFKKVSRNSPSMYQRLLTICLSVSISTQGDVNQIYYMLLDVIMLIWWWCWHVANVHISHVFQKMKFTWQKYKIQEKDTSLILVPCLELLDKITYDNTLNHISIFVTPSLEWYNYINVRGC